MVSKKNKSDMSPFLIICGSTVDPEEEMMVAGENELLLNAFGILEAVEIICSWCIMFATWHTRRNA